MKKTINLFALRVVMAFAVLCSASVVYAQTSDEPIITFKTSIYENVGASNQFSLVIGTLDAGQYIDVDCGFGAIEYETAQAVVDEETQSVTGTYIECQVSEEGIVKIYGDPAQIDYLNASGCYITEIEFKGVYNISVLDLSHNELKALDLSDMSSLQALYLSDNTFTAETPLKIGGNKPDLTILEINTIDYMDESFNLSDYPALASFDGYHNLGLTKCDPTGCPNLLRLTLDVTNVESIDVSKNPYLTILNVSNTRITELDLSNNPYLVQLYCDHVGSFNNEYKIEKLDLTNNPELAHLFCAGNKLTSLDISKCTKLVTLSATDNYLSSIDVSNNSALYIVELNKNCLDFVTLPLDPGSWNTYYYGQRNFPVEKSYKVGNAFDFSARVLREGSTTDAVLYSVSESAPESPVLVDESYYSYSNGVLTVNQVIEDSVYVAFANELFPDAILRTDKFKVKSEATYGENNKSFFFTTSVLAGTAISFGIGIDGATEANPKEFYVNLGDGNLVTYEATSAGVPSTPNVVGSRVGYGPIEVYVKEGDVLTAIESTNIKMTGANVTAAPSLRVLRIENAGLRELDLTWNRCLQSLDLSDNNFFRLSLGGANGAYEKNALTDIDLSNNFLSTLTLNNVQAIKNIDLSNNQLSDDSALDFSDADYILSVDLSNNLFETLDFTYCSIMTRLDVSDNKLTSIVMPTECNLEYFDCHNNSFTLATLPEHGSLKDENYIYAPQADYVIATKGPGIDLSSQNREINGSATVYTWKDASGKALTEGVDYTNNNGVMVFKNVSVGKIVCEMTNSAFPAFTGANVYKTTAIEAAAMPTNVIASFTTINDGDAVSLSLAAQNAGTAVYIGWGGDENLSQYMLGTSYQLFDATTKANTEVKVYTYDDSEKITVFSMSGAALSSCDVSKLTDAICINIGDAGLSQIKLPESIVLQELFLEGNNFESFDLSKYPSLRLVSLGSNALTSIDLSKNANIQEFSASNNQISSVKFDNEKLNSLYLENNNLSEISFDGAPNIEQLSLSYNFLSELDVNALPDLRVLAINNNSFTFKTLPLNNYSVYYYGNQAPMSVEVVDGKVDLSDQLMVNGTETVYRWFLGAPTENVDTGELEGEELFIDEEYTLSGGITEFLANFDGVMCVMTNAALPNVYIYTELLDVTAGIEDILADVDPNAPVEYYNLQGIKVENPENGIYIRRQGKIAIKVRVK